MSRSAWCIVFCVVNILTYLYVSLYFVIVLFEKESLRQYLYNNGHFPREYNTAGMAANFYAEDIPSIITTKLIVHLLLAFLSCIVILGIKMRLHVMFLPWIILNCILTIHYFIKFVLSINFNIINSEIVMRYIRETYAICSQTFYTAFVYDLYIEIRHANNKLTTNKVEVAEINVFQQQLKI